MKKLFLLPALFFMVGMLSAQHMEVGRWYSHFASGNINSLIQREALIYGASGKSIYYVDTRDGIMKKLDKAGGLSHTGISAFGYSSEYDALLVCYESGYVDLVYGGSDVVTIPYIADKDMDASKKINDVFAKGRYAYLATDFGVVVLDLKREEIKETYQMIASGGSYDKVTGITVYDGFYYITTGNCVKRAPVNAANLNDYSVWKPDTCFEEESLSACTLLWGGVAVTGENGMYWQQRSGEPWRRLSVWPVEEEELRFVTVSGDGAYLITGVTENESVDCRVDVFTGEAAPVFTTKDFSFPTSALIDDEGYLWAGSSGRIFKTHLQGKDKKMESYVFPSPAFDNHGKITYTAWHNVLTCKEVFDNAMIPTREPFAYSFVNTDLWSNYNAGNLGLPDDFYSASVAVEDPLLESRYYVGSVLSGLVVVEPDLTWKIYDHSNSPLARNNVNHLDIRLVDVSFDRQGDLWILENLADTTLYCLRQDGGWEAYDLRAGIPGYNVTRLNSMLVDYWQHKWVISDHTAVAVFETDGSGGVKGLRVDLNYGNDLNTTEVYCMVEDDLGHVWFGTNRGVKVIDQHARMFENPRGGFTSVEAKTIKVPRDGYLIELLKDDQVKCIAVDGANRKWLGTADHGIYLVSPDGMEEIAHFDVDNSPLLSNSIRQIVVNDVSGEVFILCDGGLMSYRGTATQTKRFRESRVRAFPNPVRPDYTGFINVRGLPNNALVKITDTKGALIYQARATGGQISWDGLSMQGRKPDSGVLLVFAAGDGKGERVVCKIFYAR